MKNIGRREHLCPCLGLQQVLLGGLAPIYLGVEIWCKHHSGLTVARSHSRISPRFHAPCAGACFLLRHARRHREREAGPGNSPYPHPHILYSWEELGRKNKSG